MSYRRISPKLKKLFGNKIVCDALTHNSNVGCTNPACWKYVSPDERRKLLKRNSR